jgi:hypothetical protein
MHSVRLWLWTSRFPFTAHGLPTDQKSSSFLISIFAQRPAIRAFGFYAQRSAAQKRLIFVYFGVFSLNFCM